MKLFPVLFAVLGQQLTSIPEGHLLSFYSRDTVESIKWREVEKVTFYMKYFCNNTLLSPWFDLVFKVTSKVK
jgi:hypothetical protein